MELNANIFLDLVKVFYTNLTFEVDTLKSQVKGVDMVIKTNVWPFITRIKFSGAQVGKGNTSVVEDFNKIQFYKSCLRNSHSQVKGFYIGVSS